MKIILSLVVGFMLLITPVAYSQVSYYGIDNVVNLDKSVNVKMTITFSDIENDFSFVFLGRMNNLNATSNAGSVSCTADSSSVTNVDCKMSLSPQKRSLELNFVTYDIVKSLGGNFFFNGNFGINSNIDSVFASVKLPEGMILSSDNSTYPITPTGFQTLSDGRRIIVTWSLSNVSSSSPLIFQLSYEPISVIASVSSYWYFFIGAILAAFVSFVVIRRFRKPKDVILSVLDNYEKSIMDCVVKAGGIINQKKIVQETNLSKAKVSRVIKNLVERGLVESERTGRTSKIKLVKKKFGYF